jgi:hypothetical protein
MLCFDEVYGLHCRTYASGCRPSFQAFSAGAPVNRLNGVDSAAYKALQIQRYLKWDGFLLVME